MSGKPRVGVLGGGFAGLEAAFAVRHKLGDAVDLTLVSDQPDFLFKPNTIYIPFGADPEQFKIPLDRPARRKDIHLVVSRARAIDPVARVVETEAGSEAFDFLVVATGAAMRPEEVPGLRENAVTVWTPEQMSQLGQRLGQLASRAKAGERQRLLFVVPPNNRCSGPLYELVLMTDTWLRRQQARDAVEIIWTTYEDGFIQAFGPRLNTVVTQEFEERGIAGFKGFVVTGVDPGVVHYQNGERRAYDLLVAFPPYVAGQRYDGLPTDDRGFVKVEPESRRVKGHDRVFAAGDVADFPIKQAFLALLQADAVAEQIAAEVKGAAARFGYEPMSMCVMEELNKATFAQVPLKYTGDPLRPVAVATDDAGHYKVGVSPLWRLGKKVLGLYLPWRFGHGEPFHEGLAWDAMDLGLRVMAKALAT